MANDNLDQIKVHLPKELKAKFVAKAKREGKSQTGILNTAIHEYLKK